jgi:hypothetical protein
LTRLENRLGVERCRHCGGLLPSPTEEEIDYVSMTNEERQAIVCRAIAAMCGREELLDLLARLRPARVADVDPLPSGDPGRGGRPG